jgi:hypothetical protein
MKEQREGDKNEIKEINKMRTFSSTLITIKEELFALIE